MIPNQPNYFCNIDTNSGFGLNSNRSGLVTFIQYSNLLKIQLSTYL